MRKLTLSSLWRWRSCGRSAPRNETVFHPVEHGADVTAVARSGQTTVDMPNGRAQRIEPFVGSVVLPERLVATRTIATGAS